MEIEPQRFPVGKLPMETVGDLDILVASEKPEPIMQRFQRYPEVDRIIASGTTRGTVVLRSGLQVDLRILPRVAMARRSIISPGSRLTTLRFASSALSTACASANTAYSAYREGKKRRRWGSKKVRESAARARKTYFARSAWIGCRPNCAGIAARFKPHKSISCPSR